MVSEHWEAEMGLLNTWVFENEQYHTNHIPFFVELRDKLDITDMGELGCSKAFGNLFLTSIYSI